MGKMTMRNRIIGSEKKHTSPAAMMIGALRVRRRGHQLARITAKNVMLAKLLRESRRMVYAWPQCRDMDSPAAEAGLVLRIDAALNQ